MLPVSLTRFLGIASRPLPGALTDLPAKLRPHAVELAAVERGAKPMARVTAREDQLGPLLRWFDARRLCVLVREQPLGPDTFGQLSPIWRPSRRERLFQLFVATAPAPLAALNPLLRQEDYEGIGNALGYPDCCVRWAGATDQRIDAGRGIGRQTNLVAEAVARSDHFHSRLNCLASESAFATNMPGSLISHYPCRFDCRPSRKQADSYALCLEDMSPSLLALLDRLLGCHIAWWSDVDWPIEWANEFPGLILQPGDANLRSDQLFVALSDRGLPGGSIPTEGEICGITGGVLILSGPDGVCEIDLAVAGQPELLRWT